MKCRAAVVLLLLLWLTAGCRSVDPAPGFIARMDQAPPEKRPKDWERTKSLMARAAPAVGQAAPNFSLRTLTGGSLITRSEHQAGRPLVLIFGSFT